MTRHAPGRFFRIAVTLLLTPVFILSYAQAAETRAAETRAAETRAADSRDGRAQIETDWTRQAVVRQLSPADNSVTAAQDAAGGCDGVINGTYGFHTSSDLQPWWQVDLGSVHQLARIVIYNRADGASERAAHLKVLLSDDNAHWKEIYQHDGTTFLGATDQKPLVIDASAESGRFVRIQLPGKSYLHLEEIQVYRQGSEANIALRKPASQSSTSSWSAWDTAGAPQDAEPETYPVAELIERGLLLAAELQKLGVNIDQPQTELRQLSQQWTAVAGRGWTEPAAQAVSDKLSGLCASWHWPIRCWISTTCCWSSGRPARSRTCRTSTTAGSRVPAAGCTCWRISRATHRGCAALPESFPAGSFLRPDLSYDGRRCCLPTASTIPD